MYFLMFFYITQKNKILNSHIDYLIKLIIKLMFYNIIINSMRGPIPIIYHCVIELNHVSRAIAAI